jgi:FecR protein
MKTRLLSALGGLALLMLLVCAALGTARAQDADPPGRVARLSDVEGSVSLQPADVPDWTAATLNRPLTTGDKLWSDQNSRAELDIGDAVIRLGSTTGFAFLYLDDSRAQLQLSAGTLIMRVRDMQASQSYEIDTPNLALMLQQPGVYRVDVSNAGDATAVRVSEGAAQAYTGAQTVAIGAQQSVSFTGTQQTVAYYSASPGTPDDLDNWSAARDLQVDDSVSSEYVAGDIPGTQDLDNSGRWQDTPEYGYVWMPTAVAVGWVPYRFGNWVWISPWGWTWVDAARWGYAPFHYGRWAQWNNAWCWVPAPRFGRPLYAPALVGWVGGPIPGTPAAFGSNVGWFPLGPREAYVPAGHVSPAYLRKVNITNTSRIDNAYLTNVYQNAITPLHYVNRRAAAVTTVPQNIFISGQAVGGHAVLLPPAVLAGSAVAAAAPALAPIRQSVLGPSEGRGAAHPPAALLHRLVIARTAPPRAPAPFDQQLAAIQANGGRPLSRAQLERLQAAATPATPVHVIAPTRAVITASALPHRAPAVHSGNSTGAGGLLAPAQVAPPSSVSFAERERTLQQSTLPPAPHTMSPRIPTYAPPAPAAAQSAAAPAWRSDRPPSAPQYVSSPQPALTPDDLPDAPSRPFPLPVFHPPEGADPGTPAQEPHHPEQRHQAPPPAAPHGAVPAATATSTAHAPPPAQTQAQPAKGPRDYAAHGDRDSRERAER